MSVGTSEAMQLRGVSKVATLTWIGHDFDLRRAPLLTLNPKPTTHTTGGAGVQTLNPTPTPRNREGEGIKH